LVYLLSKNDMEEVLVENWAALLLWVDMVVTR
jgi:hypothetical protein